MRYSAWNKGSFSQKDLSDAYKNLLGLYTSGQFGDNVEFLGLLTGAYLALYNGSSLRAYNSFLAGEKLSGLSDAFVDLDADDLSAALNGLEGLFPKDIGIILNGFGNLTPGDIAAVLEGLEGLFPEDIGVILNSFEGFSPRDIGVILNGFGNLTPGDTAVVLEGLERLLPEDIGVILNSFKGFSPRDIGVILNGLGNLTPDDVTIILEGFKRLLPEDIGVILNSFKGFSPRDIGVILNSFKGFSPRDIGVILNGFGNLTLGDTAAVLEGLEGLFPKDIGVILNSFEGFSPRDIGVILNGLGNLTPDDVTIILEGFERLLPEDIGVILNGIRYFTPGDINTVLSGFGIPLSDSGFTAPPQSVNPFLTNLNRLYQTIFSPFSPSHRPEEEEEPVDPTCINPPCDPGALPVVSLGAADRSIDLGGNAEFVITVTGNISAEFGILYTCEDSSPYLLEDPSFYNRKRVSIPQGSEPGRFIVGTNDDRGSGYVRCSLLDDDTDVYRVGVRFASVSVGISGGIDEGGGVFDSSLPTVSIVAYDKLNAGADPKLVASTVIDTGQHSFRFCYKGAYGFFCYC